MARRPVLDTDVLIDHLRGAGPGHDLVALLAPRLDFHVSAVSAFELALGASFAQDLAPARALLRAPGLQLTREAGVRGGEALRALRSQGKAIDVRDAMQAGICLAAELPLVTRNVAHFDRVDGLEVFEPEAWRLREIPNASAG